jgi:hypothetical protein
MSGRMVVRTAKMTPSTRSPIATASGMVAGLMTE